MTNHQVGHDAEKQVADWLAKQGYKVFALNWRTRRCEIDIVAQRKKTMYFIEVKSRAGQAWGSGIDYVTPRKLSQMKFAAEYWIAENDWSDDVCLAVVAVDGPTMTLTEILD